MIDHLNEERIANNYGVAHVYFEYQEQNQQTILAVMTSIVKQLLSQIPPSRFPQDVQAVYQCQKSQHPTVDDILPMLVSMPYRFSRVFVVCDALDEMDQHTQRKHLLPLFHRMKDAGIALFLTTRPHPADIQESFWDASVVELIPESNDVRRYVEERLSEDTRFKRVIESATDDIYNEIVATIVDATAGM